MKQETNVAKIRSGKGHDDVSVSTVSSGNADPCISCTTFNILAPIYKRLDKEDQSRRESQHRAHWLTRNQCILDRLLLERSSIICLQEVWLGNEELVEMYENKLGDAGYVIFKLPRTNNRGDGLLTALHKDHLTVLNYRELLFNDFGDRVAQLLHLETVFPVWQSRGRRIHQQIILVNTHLLFPHDYSYCIARLRQVYKILQYVKSYLEEQKIGLVPIILCGDWNGSKRGNVYKFLRSQGFVSSYDVAHQYSDIDAHKWVSHLNHRGNICGVDFIWLLNPRGYRKPLRTSWNEALFSMIKVWELLNLDRAVHTILHGTGLQSAKSCEPLDQDITAHTPAAESAALLPAADDPIYKYDAFAFLKAEGAGDYITYSGFCQALFELGLSGIPHGLSSEDIEHLWIQADANEDGILDYMDFQMIWDPLWADEQGENLTLDSREGHGFNGEVVIGFDVKKANLFPPEAEKGVWPENYSLSDHAPLTVSFAPRKMTFVQSFR